MDNDTLLPQGEIVIYQSENGSAQIDVHFVDENVWLSLDQLAALFDRNKSTISRHLKNIFEEDELNRDAVVAKIATTAADGKTYLVDNYVRCSCGKVAVDGGTDYLRRSYSGNHDDYTDLSEYAEVDELRKEDAHGEEQQV